jgi:hypothetical protein
MSEGCLGTCGCFGRALGLSLVEGRLDCEVRRDIKVA